MVKIFDNTEQLAYNYNYYRKGSNWSCNSKMKISSKTHYGLQAAYILARDGKNISAKQLETETGISSKYLERIMRIMTGAGIVAASRGAQGGYYLTKSPEKTTAGEIVRALEDNLEIIDCVKTGGCEKCASSIVWKKLYVSINDMLDQITLADMLEENSEGQSIKMNSKATCDCLNCDRNDCGKHN